MARNRLVEPELLAVVAHEVEGGEDCLVRGTSQATPELLRKTVELSVGRRKSTVLMAGTSTPSLKTSTVKSA